MTANKTIFLLAIIACLSLAFQPPANDGLDVSFGVYGSTPSKIGLTLNKDYTFSYHDYSIPDKSIEVSGIYNLKGNKVLLTANDNNTDFRNRQTVS